MAEFSSTTGFFRARSPNGNLSFYKIERTLSLHEKAGVYRASCNGNAFALKLFPLESELFEYESRFSFLTHPNILPPLICESGPVLLNGVEKSHAFILSEFCSNGDFDSLLRKKIKIDEKLARTYFKQLLKAVDYLYENDIAHGDIKPENAFLDENFILRLGDFDLAYKNGDECLSQGTENFRAPEVNRGQMYNPYLADIFSMAVFLFYIMSGSKLPFTEDRPEEYELFCEDPERYWEEFTKAEGSEDNFSDDFKALFEGMTRANPNERFYLDEIHDSNWLKGEVYEDGELKNLMEAKLKRIY